MAKRQSRRQRMKALSWFLFLAVVCLVIVGIAKLRQSDLSTGTELIGWSFVPLAILLGFTVHTTCGVITTRRKPCGNDAYGFLFGCTGYGHWRKKFSARLGFGKDEPQLVQRRKPANVQVLMYQPAPESEPLKVRVENSGLAICGFWVGVVAALAAIVQIITASVIH
jgi:hypothetical protein